MDRRDFIKKAGIAGLAATISSGSSFSTAIENKNSASDKFPNETHRKVLISVSRTVHRNYTPENLGIFAPRINYVDVHRPVLFAIAEFDCQKLCIKRESVTLIDKCRPGEPCYVRLSNFGCYQDRQSGNIVLHMTRDPGNFGWKPQDGISRDTFRYDIKVN